jgi:hypothetical protein
MGGRYRPSTQSVIEEHGSEQSSPRAIAASSVTHRKAEISAEPTAQAGVSTATYRKTLIAKDDSARKLIRSVFSIYFGVLFWFTVRRTPLFSDLLVRYIVLCYINGFMMGSANTGQVFRDLLVRRTPNRVCFL